MKKFIAKLAFPVIYLYSRFLMKKDPLKVYSESETIRLLFEGYSIARFGDADFNIAMGRKNEKTEYQKYSVKLEERLLEVLRQDLNERSRFLVAIPLTMSTYKGFRFRQIRFWSVYNASKRNWVLEHLFRKGKNQQYGDALFARISGFKNYTQEEFWNKVTELQQIWRDKYILIVEGENTKLGVDNDLLSSAKRISRILIPAENAFEHYEAVLKCVCKQEKPNIVLIVAGAMATVMAYDLYKKGCQVIDIGQFNDDYKDAAMKFGGFQGTILEEQDYEKQIVCRI